MPDINLDKNIVNPPKDIRPQSGLQRLGDFLLGFICTTLIMFYSLFTGFAYESGWIIIAIFLIFIFVGSYSSKKGRKFITIGIAMGILIIPLLLFGSCIFEVSRI